MLTNTSLEKIIEQDSSSATQMNIIYECNLGHLKSITNCFFHELKINTSVNEFKLFVEECNKKKTVKQRCKKARIKTSKRSS